MKGPDERGLEQKEENMPSDIKSGTAATERKRIVGAVLHGVERLVRTERGSPERRNSSRSHLGLLRLAGQFFRPTKARKKVLCLADGPHFSAGMALLRAALPDLSTVRFNEPHYSISHLARKHQPGTSVPHERMPG